MDYTVKIRDTQLLHRSSSQVLPLDQAIHYFCWANRIHKPTFIQPIQHVCLPLFRQNQVIAGGYVRVLCLNLFQRYLKSVSCLSLEHNDIDIWDLDLYHKKEEPISLNENRIQLIPIHSRMNLTRQTLSYIITFFDWTCTQACLTLTDQFNPVITVTPAFIYSILNTGAMFAACSFRNHYFKWPFELDVNLRSTYEGNHVRHPITMKLNLVERYLKYKSRGYRDVLNTEDSLQPLLSLWKDLSRQWSFGPMEMEILYEWDEYWKRRD